MTPIKYPVWVDIAAVRGGFKVVDCDQEGVCYGYDREVMNTIANALNAAHDMRWRTVAEEVPPEGEWVIHYVGTNTGQFMVRAKGGRWQFEDGDTCRIVPTDLWHPIPPAPEPEVTL